MNKDELSKNFDVLRGVLAEEMRKPQNKSEEAQRAMGFVADAQEQIALNTQPHSRP